MTPTALSTVIKQGVQATTFLFLAWCATPTAQAASIRLDDQTNLTGDVLRVEDDAVLIAVPRGRIKTINGEPLPTPLVKGSTAPLFSVQDLLGRPQVLGAPPHAITILHFWISWCPHCQSDAPELQALYERFRHNPEVQFITVSLDREHAVVEQFVTERHLTYPVIIAAEQAAVRGQVDLVALYQVNAFPVTYLIDEEGVIRQKIMGSFAESGSHLGEQILAMVAKRRGSVQHNPRHA